MKRSQPVASWRVTYFMYAQMDESNPHAGICAVLPMQTAGLGVVCIELGVKKFEFCTRCVQKIALTTDKVRKPSHSLTSIVRSAKTKARVMGN
jgi:hypothetical protein